VSNAGVRKINSGHPATSEFRTKNGSFLPVRVGQLALVHPSVCKFKLRYSRLLQIRMFENGSPNIPVTCRQTRQYEAIEKSLIVFFVVMIRSRFHML
jgi:hypothetical protein